MSIKSQVTKIVNFFNSNELDNRGGLLIPFDLKISDSDYFKYRHLDMDPSIPSLTSDDLPIEFSEKSVKLVDVFRRKTFDLDYEVMLIFDYITSEIIYCFVNDTDNNGDYIQDEVDARIFDGKHIASIHNHSGYFSSPPSAENFQILELEFEEYELILSKGELWILESKEIIKDKDIIDIKEEISKLFYFSQNKISKEFGEDLVEKRNELYGKLLMEYISNCGFNINLEKRVLK